MKSLYTNASNALYSTFSEKQAIELNQQINSLHAEMARCAGVHNLRLGLPDEYYQQSKYRASCGYCRTNPGKSETCKNCGAPIYR